MKVVSKSLPYGIMVYWDEEIAAASYCVHLLIGTDTVDDNGKIYIDFQELAAIDLEKTIKYYSFINLGLIDKIVDPNQHSYVGGPSYKSTGKNYYVYVEALDKVGNIIVKSETIVGRIQK